MINDNINILSILESLADSTDKELDKHTAVLYIADNPITNKYYIGVTNDNTRRKNQHDRYLRNNIHYNEKFQEAYNENPNFSWKEIPVENMDVAFYIEKTLIHETRGDPNCLNIKESVKREPTFTGRNHTEETKKLLSEISTKQWESSEARLRQSEQRKQFFANGGEHHQRGKPLTIKEKERLIEGTKNYYYSLTESEREAFINKRVTPLMKPVIVNDKEYPSQKAASIGENVTPPTVRDRIRSKNFPEWKYK